MNKALIDFDRIEAANAPLNAFTSIDRSAIPGEGLLKGVTVGVKANIAVKGQPWTAGMALHRDRIAQRDAATVAALRDAGAALIGMLNMEEAALGATTDNPFFGRTENPHRIGHTPGGSSGGSGSAVAAGLCDLALGTDTMGSVRIPASYCGVWGFKPAQSAVSQDGLEIAEPSLDVIGPLARDPDMLERAARIMSKFGEAGIDGPVVTLEGLGDVECAPRVLTAYEKACEALAVHERFTLPHSPSRIRYAGFIATTRALSEALDGLAEEALSPHLRQLIAHGTRRKPESLAEDRSIMASTSDALHAVLEQASAILLPTAPQPAFAHGTPAPANQADFTCLANMADLPAITLPAGWTEDGLPVGVQLIGRRGHEAGLFALARQLDARLRAGRPPAHFLNP